VTCYYLYLWDEVFGPAFIKMNRRLKVAIEQLTGELVTFRQSSDAASGKLSRLTNVLIGFTTVLVVLTFASVVLTIVIAAEK
jgi:hypothetical protein